MERDTTFEFLDSPESVTAYGSLRAQILASLGRDRPKTLLVVPVSDPETGADVAIGIAVSLAAAGNGVVLADAQFEQPEIHEHFGKDQGPGLAEALQDGSSTAAPVLQPVSRGISLLPAGHDENLKLDLLASAKLRGIFENLTGAGNWVIVAGSGPGRGGWAASIAPLVDITILAATHGESLRGEAVAARASLDGVGANILGIVMVNPC